MAAHVQIVGCQWGGGFLCIGNQREHYNTKAEAMAALDAYRAKAEAELERAKAAVRALDDVWIADGSWWSQR